MERRNEWMNSYHLASDSIARQRELSRHRYLDAAAWFESIPSFYQNTNPAISPKTFDHAAQAARAAFAEDGVCVSERRVRQLFAPLRTPSLAMRLRAAMAHVRERFGVTALPESAESLISKITRLRGLLAHGEDFFSANAAQDMHELVLLLETVCGLLTLSGLPWELERLKHAHQHPMQNARWMLSNFESMRGK
jgi:hypothetical protein